MRETWVRSLDGKIPGEGHSNPLQDSRLENWEPDELQFMASQRVGHDWVSAAETSNTKSVCDGLKCWPQLFTSPWSLE